MLRRLVERVVERGLHPSWVGYQHVPRETVRQYFERHAGSPSAGRFETVHPESVASNPLPRNVENRDQLPADAGWWGYSFRDVPSRVSAETFVATLPRCTVVCYRDETRAGDFYPAVMTADGRGLDLRELRFRPRHGETLRLGAAPVRLAKATWIAERVYHNHSHWLTAHLPKLLLLRERDALDDVLLPAHRTPAMEASLRMLGFAPERFRTFDEARPLQVGELTLVGTDRFRPELLGLVPRASGVLDLPRPHRRVFISRAGATRRRLVNEDDVWTVLEPAGFERIRMEEMPFDAQVALMKETKVLVGPHGAGLTNMMFCPPGAQVVELATLSFPNPNFYAVAGAMRHDYWLLDAEALGEQHPLQKDLRADVQALRDVIPRVLEAAA